MENEKDLKSISEEIEEGMSGYEVPETEELIDLISQRRYKTLRARTENIPPQDIAEIMNDLPESISNIFFRLLPKELAAEVFALLDTDKCRELISLFTDKELSLLLEELYIDDAVDIIEEMPAAVVKRILKSAKRETRDEINALLRYPKDTAGTIMTTEYVRLRGDMTVAEALEHIREVAIDKETIYTSFVTDDKKTLLGIVTAKRLLLASPEEKISSIMEDRVIFALTDEDKEEVADKFDKYGFISLPVVDKEKRLVGIVTVDDAIEVIIDEAEEDISKMAAIIPTDTPYLKESTVKTFMARMPWLLFLMISATFSGAILGFFEGNLIPVLTVFVPMLMSTGGNSGSQASVTAIRAFASGEITMRDTPRLLFKEMRVGILCGLLLGAVSFGKVMLVDRFLLANPSVTVFVAFAVSATLAVIVIVAKALGCILPALAKAIGLDPAVMASPLITTLVDVLALLVYFFISSNLFGLVA